jgi:prepilin-type N-terminal cleavage/methylation domain-containing protein
MKRDSGGFTLIEIAVVLVIIGLLLGGVLKGQELITSARVRNLISQQEGVRAAFLGFQDRYRALPGDYSAASRNMNCGALPCLEGDGNGMIEAPNFSAFHEEILLWAHLSAAGFLNGSYSMTDPNVVAPDSSNTPTNPYGVYIALAYENNWGQPGNTVNRHNLKTGNQVPVEILAEIDRKIDDGRPYTGSLQFSAYTPTGSNAPNPATCVLGSDWNIKGGDANCGATTLF